MPGASPDSTSPFDEALALERLGGDRALFLRLCEVYRGALDGMLAPLQEHAAAGDLEALARAAHKLKGSTANFAAGPAHADAAALEAAARGGDAAKIPACLQAADASARALGGALPRG